VTLRAANPGELPGSAAGATWSLVCEEEGKVVGFVACSLVDGQAWVHDLSYRGSNRHAASRLIQAAKQQLKVWGVREYWCNVTHGQDGLLSLLLRKGLRPAQYILKGELR
jgi:hypothetical protein